MSDDIPYTVSTGELDFLGLKVLVHVLSDGRRVVEKADMERVMRILADGDAAGDA